MSPGKFQRCQARLGHQTHKETAAALGVSEVSVKRYATCGPVPASISLLITALVFMKKVGCLEAFLEYTKKP